MNPVQHVRGVYQRPKNESKPCLVEMQEGSVCTSLAVRVVVAHTPSRDFRLDSHTKGKTKEKETAVYTTLSKT